MARIAGVDIPNQKRVEIALTYIYGIGRDVHEQPDVPNYGTPGRGPRLCAGLVIAIEPMVNAGAHEVREMADGWTVKTVDGSLSAHYENTVALTEEGIINLTEVEIGE